MDGINRKPMQDVLVPQNDVIKRPSFMPEPRPAISISEDSSRIEKSPFFEKGRNSRPLSAPIQPKKDNSRFLVWSIAMAALLGAAFVVLSYFSSATIEVFPFTQSVKIENEFTATKDTAGEELSFQFLSLSEEKTVEVSATVEKAIQKKASGKVIIYNAYSAAPQRLIKNTRLESADHKIFRINDSVVVPGAKVVSGKVTEPGFVETVVYADAPGKEYNIGLADFTIPGFKGDPRYSKFTARSKADSPLAGGFSGTVKVPTDEAVTEAQKGLKEELKKTAVEKARGQVPDSVSFFPGSMVLKFEEVPQELSADEAASVTVRATVSVFFFNTELLTQKIANAVLKEYKGAALTLPNISELSFTFLDPVDTIVLADLTQIRFRLDGEALFKGHVDEGKLIAEIAGKSKKDFSSIITTQSNIKRANAVVRPMWKTSFPGDITKISVEIVNE
ncbi:MAG TPA: hypothetical protein DCS20_02060 [Candidatus Yonathbacteria bacterium]|nr:hypothetical protein [Candidatus Yonathbacteria bacterium]